MAKTAQLDLPLVMPSQAQKHVTVNEALARLDAAAQLTVVSSAMAVPPADAPDGTSFLVPEGAAGDWLGRAGEIAVRSNGGWAFLVPKAGWRAWDAGRNGPQIFDGAGWVADGIAVTPNGSGLAAKVLEFDHVVTAGPSNTTATAIPQNAQVLGVSGRVTSAVTGDPFSSWRIGVAGSDDRYGSGLGGALNSYLVGLSGSPVTYYANTPLVLTAESGTFASGTIRLAVHLLQIEPPRAV